jgi:hypothetical protein
MNSLKFKLMNALSDPAYSMVVKGCQSTYERTIPHDSETPKRLAEAKRQRRGYRA